MAILTAMNTIYWWNKSASQGSTSRCRADKDCTARTLISPWLWYNPKLHDRSQWNRSSNEFRIIRNFLSRMKPVSACTAFIDHFSISRTGTFTLWWFRRNRRNDAASRDSYFDDVENNYPRPDGKCIKSRTVWKLTTWKYQSVISSCREYPPFLPFLSIWQCHETFVSMTMRPSCRKSLRKINHLKEKKISHVGKPQPFRCCDNLFYWILSPCWDQYPERDDTLPGR